MQNNSIEIYTDGSSLGNPGPGGWGVVVIGNEELRVKNEEFGGYEKDTTNNRMELQGAIEALKYVKENNLNTVVVHTDSSYVLGGITSWVFNWEKNGWRKADKKEVLNQDLWKELLSLQRELAENISWEKVKGHSGHVHNDRADEIATGCADKQENL